MSNQKSVILVKYKGRGIMTNQGILRKIQGDMDFGYEDLQRLNEALGTTAQLYTCTGDRTFQKVVRRNDVIVTKRV